MHAEEIRSAMREQPFRPLRFFLSDGSVHEVRHPELIVVTRRAIFLALPSVNGEEDELPERYVRCDPLHVTRIEPLNVPSD